MVASSNIANLIFCVSFARLATLEMLYLQIMLLLLYIFILYISNTSTQNHHLTPLPLDLKKEILYTFANLR